MANLLAVLVSLAITAIVAVTGISYTGTAFSVAGGKVRANQIIDYLQQINQAWSLYDSDNGITATIAKLIANGTYLSGAPAGITGLTNCLAGDATCVAATSPYMVDSGGGTPLTYVSLDNTNTSALPICLEIARNGGQCTTAQIVANTCVPASPANTANFNTAFASYRMACYQVPAATAATINGITVANADAGYYIIFLKH